MTPSLSRDGVGDGAQATVAVAEPAELPARPRRPGALVRLRWRRHPGVEAVAAAVVLSLIGLVPGVWKPYLAAQVILMVAIVDLAILWNVVAGFAGQLSLVHGAMFGVGAYSVAALLTNLDLSPWIGLAVGAAISAALGLLVALVTVRFQIRGIYFALVTLAIALLLDDVATNSHWLGAAVGINMTPGNSPGNLEFASLMPYAVILLALGWVLFVASRRLRRHRFGAMLLATKDDELALQSLGRSVGTIVAVIMVLTGALAGVVGSVYVLAALDVTPGSVLGPSMAFPMLIATIIGGIGTIWGPLVGAIVYEGALIAITQIPSASTSLPIIVNAVFGGIIVALVALRPKGIIGR